MRVLSVDPATLVAGDGADGEAAAAVDESGAVVVIALHGIKAARLVIGCQPPMILVTGGTDVNVDIVTDSQKAATMARVMRWEGTAAVVSFSGAMIEAMHALLEATADMVPTCIGETWRTGAPPVHLIPQGVELPPRPPPGSELAALVQQAIGKVLRDGEVLSAARERVLLLVAGLRPVLCPAHFLLTWAAWCLLLTSPLLSCAGEGRIIPRGRCRCSLGHRGRLAARGSWFSA